MRSGRIQQAHILGNPPSNLTKLDICRVNISEVLNLVAVTYSIMFLYQTTKRVTNIESSILIRRIYVPPLISPTTEQYNVYQDFANLVDASKVL